MRTPPKSSSLPAIASASLRRNASTSEVASSAKANAGCTLMGRCDSGRVRVLITTFGQKRATVGGRSAEARLPLAVILGDARYPGLAMVGFARLAVLESALLAARGAASTLRRC